MSSCFQRSLSAKHCNNARLVQIFLEGLDARDLRTLAQGVSAEYKNRSQAWVEEQLEAKCARETRFSQRAAALPSTPFLGVEDFDAVDEFLAAGHDVDAADGERRTALWLAARHGDVQVLRKLLAHGANVDKPALGKKTPLYAATAAGHVACVAALVGAGAAVAAGPEAPLLVACRLGNADIVRELVKGGASDERDEALYEAASRGDAGLVELLCDSGATAARCERPFKFPLLVAAGLGFYDVVAALCSRGVDLYATDHDTFADATSMTIALDPRSGFPSSYRGPKRDGPLVPDERLARLLVEHGYDVNRLRPDRGMWSDAPDGDAWGRRAEDVGFGERLVVFAARKDCAARQTVCVDLVCGTFGADVDACDQMEPFDSYDWVAPQATESALDVACRKGHLALVTKLVDTYGATVHTPRPAGMLHRRVCGTTETVYFPLPTPVEWLVDSAWSAEVPERLLILRFLLAHGAQVGYRTLLDYYESHLGSTEDRASALEQSSVSELLSQTGPLLEFGDALHAAAREQEDARRAALTRGLLLARSPGGRATVGGGPNARLERGIDLLARASRRGAWGARFAGGVLGYLYSGAAARAAKRFHEVAYRAATT